MKQLAGQSKSADLTQACAAEMMDVLPVLIQAFRADIRRQRPANLSVPQFRVLLFLRHHAGASLSAIAEQIGVTLPTASKLVEGLVKRKFISRETSSDDRRRVTIQLTEQGTAVTEQVRQEAMTQLSHTLAALSDEEQHALYDSMRALRRVVCDADPISPTEGGRS